MPTIGKNTTHGILGAALLTAGMAAGATAANAASICLPGAPVTTFADKPVQVKLKGIR